MCFIGCVINPLEFRVMDISTTTDRQTAPAARFVSHITDCNRFEFPVGADEINDLREASEPHEHDVTADDVKAFPALAGIKTVRADCWRPAFPGDLELAFVLGHDDGEHYVVRRWFPAAGSLARPVAIPQEIGGWCAPGSRLAADAGGLALTMSDDDSIVGVLVDADGKTLVLPI
jgi:hypothetical protein